MSDRGRGKEERTGQGLGEEAGQGQILRGIWQERFLLECLVFKYYRVGNSKKSSSLGRFRFYQPPQKGGTRA